MRAEHRIWLAILIASLGWGTGGTASRAVLGMGVPPIRLAFVRVAIATSVLVLFLLADRRRLPAGARIWGQGLVLGVTNLTLPYVLFTIAVQYVSAGFAGLIAALIPAMTAVWAHFLLADEGLRGRKIIGLAVAFAGVGWLLASGESGIGPAGRPLLGGILGVAAVASASYGGVYGRRHAVRHTVLDLAVPQFVVGTALLGPATILGEGIVLEGMPVPGWALLGYLALASAVLPFLLFFWLLQRVSATRASLVGYLVPLVAVTTGAILLGERIGPGMAAGGALILAGVILVDRAESRLEQVPATPTM